MILQMSIKNSIRIYYQNARGLKTKCNVILNNVLAEDYDMIIITETWLNDSVFSGEILDDRYVIYRRDRDPRVANKCDGGGVLIAIKNKFVSERIPTLETELEDLWIKVKFNLRFIYICVIYFPPSTHIEKYQTFYSVLENNPKISCSELIILGDFNISKSDPAFTIANNMIENEFINFLNVNNISQCNYVTNKDNKILDLILSNTNVTVERSEFSLVKADLYHPPLEILHEVDIYDKVNIHYSGPQYMFNKANFIELYRGLRSTDWNTMNSYRDVDTMVSEFYNLFYAVLDKTVPKSKPKIKLYPPWFTPNIIKKIKLKSRLFKKLKSQNTPLNVQRYKNIRTEIKTDINESYKKYVRDVESNIKNDPATFWSFLKNKKATNSTLKSMSLDDRLLYSNEEIVEAFAENFKSVYNSNTQVGNNDTTDEYDLVNNSLNNLNITGITNDDIVNAIKKLKPKKSVGHDLIPIYIFKGCSDILSYPLIIIFNKIISTNTYPSAWKIAKICPIFKNGQRSNIKNYRPISILPAVSKIFESVLYSKFFNHVKTIICDNQHGFMPKRSTTTNLIDFTQEISEALDENLQTDVIYTDFAKAFDKVSHSILLSKLKTYGFSDNLIELTRSYLTNRIQYVVYNNHESQRYLVNSGVPQGANLGPLLFLLFINDLPSVLKHSHALLFADDLKIWRNINSIEDCVKLQTDIDNLFLWSQKNKLFFNISKCYYLSYSRKFLNYHFDYSMNREILEKRDEIKDLGVIFDTKLSFKYHVMKMVNDAFSALGFVIRQTQMFSSRDSVVTLYNYFVRSKLEYASLSWSPLYYHYINEIEKVQKRFIRYLYYKEKGNYPLYTHYLDLLKEYPDIMTLEKRRCLTALSFLYKALNNKTDIGKNFNKFHFFVPRQVVRFNQLFYITRSRTNILINSPYYRMFKYANAVNDHVDFFSLTNKKFINTCKYALNLHEVEAKIGVRYIPLFLIP